MTKKELYQLNLNKKKEHTFSSMHAIVNNILDKKKLNYNNQQMSKKNINNIPTKIIFVCTPNKNKFCFSFFLQVLR